MLHTPGHTSSNVCYLYRSPHGKRYLFVGDTLYLDRGQWKTLVVSADGGNRGELNASLRFLRQFDVDVVICSVSVGEAEVAEITPEQWHDLLDSLLEQAD